MAIAKFESKLAEEKNVPTLTTASIECGMCRKIQEMGALACERCPRSGGDNKK